jgi:hypothetical protein
VSGDGLEDSSRLSLSTNDATHFLYQAKVGKKEEKTNRWLAKMLNGEQGKEQLSEFDNGTRRFRFSEIWIIAIITADIVGQMGTIHLVCFLSS